MSKLDKLAIIGIRSFDNVRQERIQFFTPLTLIVGHNGSGKTTIIECLRYATTGDLPPNSKGGAFIHDPKLCGESEIIAKVQLSFKATGGARMVASRSLQLTVKKLSRQQKSLESQLLMLKNGDRKAISSRVSELDALMPQYLGVSKAILDNVIFCHQDDSLWPMSEPSVLKKKFDEIFEALKYTKAIDNIKAIRKKQMEELGKFKILEEQYRVDRDRADKIQRQSSGIADEIEKLRADNEALVRKLREALDESNELWRQAKSFEGVIGELNGLRIRARTKQESVDDLRERIMEMEEDDEWLVSTLAQYEERMQVLKDGIEKQEQRNERLRDDVDESRHQLGQRQTEAGRLKADEEQHMRNLERQETVVKAVAHKHGVSGFDQDLDQARVRDFTHKIGRISRERNTYLGRVKQDNRDATQNAQNELNQHESRRSAYKLTSEQAKRSVIDCKGRIGQLEADKRNLPVDNQTMLRLQVEEESLRQRLVATKAEFTNAEYDSKITAAQNNIRNKEDAGEKLNAEMIQSTREAADNARLDFLRIEVKAKERTLNTQEKVHADRIAEVVGSSWEVRTVERELIAQIDQRKADLLEARLKNETSSRNLNELDFTLKNAKDQVSKNEAEQVQCKNKVIRVLDEGEDIESYHDAVKLLQKNRDTLTSDLSNFKATRDWFEKSLTTAKSHDTCRLCERHFTGNTEKSRFIHKLETLLSKNQRAELEKDLQETEASLSEAREAAPYFEIYTRLKKTTLPDLRSQLAELQKKRSSLADVAEAQLSLVNDRTESVKVAESLLKPVQNLAKLAAEKEDFLSQIQQLTALGDRASTRSVDDIQSEMTKLTDQIRELRNSASQYTSARDEHRTRLNSLELEIRDAAAKCQDAQSQIERKADLEKRVDEFRQSIKSHEENKTRAEEQISALLPQIDQAQARYDDVVARGIERENEAQREATELMNSLNRLQTIEHEIQGYENRGGSQRLSSCEEEINQLEAQIADCIRQKNEIDKEIEKVKGQQENNEETKRSIQDNLRYRRDVKALQETKDRIDTLASQNAEADREMFKQRAEETTTEYNKLSAEQASLMSLMKSKDDQLEQLIADWETEYKDAAKNYKESKIRVEATKACIDDLGKYSGALDKAIMKFHSIKMEEINRIIEELWRGTYQGTDLDSILIRSDNESPNAKAGNRSYNYRVCMIKSGAEMDMRGRCSAGQKVLASIIIRLALAECFGTNCGVIALDEPTTNLDRENIQSLAESLHDIIKLRRQQNNFQLIVITHDEDFLRAMQCGDFCDEYYRVRRDDRQKSTIVKQSIAEVMS